MHVLVAESQREGLPELVSDLLCSIGLVPRPGCGLWFGFLHFTFHDGRVAHVTDYGFVSQLPHLWS